MNETKVTINQKEFVVKKMPLGRYAELLNAIEELPPEVTKEIAGLDKISTDQFLSKLPLILGKSFPKLVKAISAASGIPEDILLVEADLVEAVQVVKAIFEVNDFLAVKNALVAAFQKKPTATEKPATG